MSKNNEHHSKIPLKNRRSSSVQGSSARASLAVHSSGRQRSSSVQRGQGTSFYPSAQVTTSRLPPQDYMKDLRPLNEKRYRERTIHKITNILSSNQYPHQIQLTPFSNAEFRKVFEFIMSLVLPGFRLSQRMEEEVPKAMRSIGYPFNISKTTLTTIGALHSWPQALAILDFLCEFIDMTFISPPDPIVDNEISNEYRKRAYNTFFFQTDEITDYSEDNSWLKQQLMGSLKEDYNVKKAEYEKLALIVEKLNLKQEQNNHNIEMQIRSKNDLTKIELYINNFYEYNEKQKQHLDSIKHQLHQHNQRVNELKNAIAEQELKYSSQKESGHLLVDLQRDHTKFRKIVASYTEELGQYNVNKTQLQQKNRDNQDELLESLRKLCIGATLIGIDNGKLDIDFSNSFSESELSEIFKNITLLLEEVRLNRQGEKGQLELLFAQRSTEFEVQVAELRRLKQDFAAVTNKIAHMESTLAGRNQLEQNMVACSQELSILKSQELIVEKEIEKLKEDVEQQKIKNKMKFEQDEYDIKLCQQMLEETREQYQSKIISAANYLYQKHLEFEELAKYYHRHE